ncbi:relaxase/mobilization nuclease [Streptomyces sp. NPDC021100]|uniref:relaxase/mobilization nuclease n=1 Tax=Streptomyces sp. NPDC021100 TaxID=3365114 RepID=UPI00379DC55A
MREITGRLRALEEELSGQTVLAHSPGLAAAGREGPPWGGRDVTEYLAGPARESGYGEHEERPFLFHLAVRLHPDERTVSRAEWSQVAHRIVRAAGIAPPGEEQACRWVAFQPRAGRLDLLANLIREDGTRARPSRPLHTHLESECRRISQDLGLRTAGSRPIAPSDAESAVAGAAQAACVHRLAGESDGPLAAVRRQLEQAAYLLAGLPDGQGGDASRRLEWAARRLYALQEDLQETATVLGRGIQHLPPTATTPVPATTAAVPARRSR